MCLWMGTGISCQRAKKKKKRQKQINIFSKISVSSRYRYDASFMKSDFGVGLNANHLLLMYNIFG